MKLVLKSGNWNGTVLGGGHLSLAKGDVIDVSDEAAKHLLSEDCAGDFEVVKEEKKGGK